MASIPRLVPSEKWRKRRRKLKDLTSHFNCVFFWIHYNGDNSIVFEALPASVLIWWSQIPVYLLRLPVASKLNLRLSNLQLIPNIISKTLAQGMILVEGKYDMWYGKSHVILCLSYTVSKCCSVSTIPNFVASIN
jgi:hypothetical protein